MATEKAKKGKKSTGVPVQNVTPEALANVAKEPSAGKEEKKLEKNAETKASKKAGKKKSNKIDDLTTKLAGSKELIEVGKKQKKSKEKDATQSVELINDSATSGISKELINAPESSKVQEQSEMTLTKNATMPETNFDKEPQVIQEPTEQVELEEATNIDPTLLPVVQTEETSESNSSSLKITFQLKYSTKFGQNLFITANHEVFGNNDLSNAFPMQYYNQEYWVAEVEIPGNISEPIRYNYYVTLEDGSGTIEWGNDKVINPSAINSKELLLVDSWNYAGFYENTFYLEPFKQVLLRDNYTATENNIPSNFTHTFRVKAPLLQKNEVLFVTGNIPEFNNWNIEEVLFLNKHNEEDWWSIQLDLSNATYPISYKYGVYNIQEKKWVRLEEGQNRWFYNLRDTKAQTIVSDGFAWFPNNTFKGAGVAIPVFSLRTENGFGVGEFNDLKGLVDWAKSIGLKLIQILPINDTTATYTNADSYPYAAISAFALHPIYLNLASVVNEENKELLTALESKRQQLNSLDSVDYKTVVATKLAFIKEIFPSQKVETFNTEEFQSYFKTNAHWLVPYAAFSFFRDKYQTADFSKWPSNNSFNASEIDELAGSALTADPELSIHYFIQYHLHLQLKAAAEYAHQNGIIVKGDIPIGIFRNSADAWQEPELYNMDKQAGAPPDDFAVKGQNWGFPTYNWHKMAQDGFTWWKRRFEQMSYYFDAFRIDHILGFFRIWSIPMDGVEGIMGQFVPALPVHISEFHQRGLSFDSTRFTKPYITDHILWELFGSETEPVKRQFLQAKGNGLYELTPAYNTQRKVEAYFATLQQSTFNKKLQQGLFDLISNVILFEVEGSQGQEFHFRIAVDSTTSFQHLDEGTKYHLKELYINYFFRRQDDFWRKEAMLKLPELKRSTNMLICGEDLGMVPASVPGVMKDLAILSLEIQRMPKDPTREFFHPNDAPYLSVVTPSTHDMSTIRGWWEEDREKTQRFYNSQLGEHGAAPQFCDAWINKAIIVQHFYSPAMWSIFQLQDLMGSDEKIRRGNPHDERINVPADPKHFWRYRMHLNVEDLLHENEFNFELKTLVTASGR